jgi:hypothetical protein
MRHYLEGSERVNFWILQSGWRPRLLLIFMVACFYSGAVLINNELLFFWARDASYRYWFYPPAGIRLALLMLLGLPGLIGYFVAALAILSSEIIPEITGFYAAFLVAVARALSLWLGLVLYGAITGIKHPWDRLTWQHVPFLALFVSFLSAVTAHVIYLSLGVESLDTLVRGVALNVLGDTLGTIFILILIIRIRKEYLLSRERSEQSRNVNGVAASD